MNNPTKQKDNLQLPVADIRDLLGLSHHNKQLIRDLFVQNPEYNLDQTKQTIKEITLGINKLDFEIFTDMILEQAKTNSDFANIYIELIKDNKINDEQISAYHDMILKQAKTNSDFANIYIELIKDNKINDEQISAYHDMILKQAKTDSVYADIYIELIKANCVRDKNKINEFADIVLGESETHPMYADIYIELIKANCITDKNKINEFADIVLGESETYPMYANVYIELIKANCITDKNKINGFADIVLGKAKKYLTYANMYIELIKANCITDKNKINEFADIVLGEAKTDLTYANVYIELIKANCITDKNKINKFADIVLGEAETYPVYADIYIELIKANCITDKNKINGFADIVLGKAKTDFFYADIYIELIKANCITDKNKINKFADIVLGEAKTDSVYADIYIELIKANCITDKNKINEFADIVLGESETYPMYANVYIELIKANCITDKNKINKFADIVLGESETHPMYADIYIELIKANCITDKNKINEFADIVLGESETYPMYANVYIELIKANCITDKNKINKFADIVLGESETHPMYADIYIELIKANYIYLSDEKIQNEDVYKNIVSKHSFGIKKLVTDNVLDKSKLEYLSKMLDLYPNNQTLLSKSNIINQNQLDKFISLYDTQNHRGLLDQYISIRHQSGLNDEQKIDYAKYQQFMIKFGNNKDIEYYLLDSRKEKIRSIHDAMEKSDQIIKLCDEWTQKGYTTDDNFVSQLLASIGQSNVGYEKFNDFLAKYNPKFLELAKAEIDDKENGIQDPEFIKLYNHIYSLHQNKQLYNQYGSLKLITKLNQILINKKSLNKLSKLLKSNNPSDITKYDYFRKGIFDPRSNSELFIKLLDNPKEIFDMNDGHANDTIHEAFKPNNIIDAEYYDLSAEDLVMALVDGSIDKINYFKSMYVYYIIGPGGDILGDIGSILVSMDNKELSKIITDYNNNNQDDKINFGNLKKGLQNLNNNQQEYIKNRIVKSKFPDQKCSVLLAQILPKSEPSNRFNGVNCDKFADGNGKKVVQVMNPMSSEFTIYKGNKMLVNSWLNLNQEKDKSFDYNLQNIKNGDVVTINTLPSEYIITADNVEAIGNHGLSPKLTHDIYQDFFTKYISNNPNGPKNIPIKTNDIYIGSMHNKINIGEGSIPNKNIPIIPNSYTDNSGSDTETLKLNTQNDRIRNPKITGVYNIGPEDLRNVCTLENESYLSIGASVGYASMRSEILGSMINQISKNRQNLSYVGYKDNKLVGYMLAYESTDHIYISDRNCTNPKMAISMMNQLISDMNSIDKSKNLIMRSRDATSLSIVRKMVTRNNLKILSEEDDKIGNEKFTKLIIQR